MEYTREMFLWQQTYATLFSVSNKLQVKGDKALESLTSRQLMALIAIIHLPKGEASLNSIAKKMGTTKQNVKQLVDAMEKKGFVKIIPSETDKRAYNIEISEERKNDFIECYMRGMNFFAEIFKGFTESELESFWGMLKKLYCFDGETQDGFEETANFDMN
ncbi:DNA-binding MarR family transcriptional regulator [Kineothrix alysoides]|uniref:DNA-binding MarR family transcriptional regulator n=1 Tax=Kineothrix alysoides TaxID=1469948 RepID=A0A4R1QLR5_9FIRM